MTNEFKEPIPALVKRNGYVRTCSSHQLKANRTFGIDLVTGHSRLEAAKPGAVAHMSLHLKPTMSKIQPKHKADNQCSPISKTGGLAVLYVGDRTPMPR